jgi:ABC-2 type transport system permease protein
MRSRWRINPTLLGFMKKEFRQALRDPRMRMLLFVAPMVQLTLFGVALNTDVTNVRLSYQRRSGDTMLEHVYQRALASGWFLPVTPSGGDPFQQIQADEADAVLVPPPEGLTSAVARGSGQLQLLVNGSNVIRAQGVETYIKSILAMVVATDLKQTPVTPPIQFDLRILYNPTMRTAVFMVPGVMSMLVCMITILLTSMSISREKETGTFEMLIAAPVKTYEVILGKTVPYVVLGMSNIPLILAVAVFVFGVPMRGSLLVLAVAALLFVCTTVAIGTFISTTARTQQQSMMGGFLFLFPAIQLSGMMFPLENMPFFMKMVAYLNPLTYFLELLRNIMLKGGETSVILSHLLYLAVFGTVVTWISFRRFRTTLG